MEIVGINKELVQKILHEHLNTWKVYSKMVLKNFTPKQNSWMNICVDILKTIKKKPTLLEDIKTCDESWLIKYDLETKRQ